MLAVVAAVAGVAGVAGAVISTLRTLLVARMGGARAVVVAVVVVVAVAVAVGKAIALLVASLSVMMALAGGKSISFLPCGSMLIPFFIYCSHETQKRGGAGKGNWGTEADDKTAGYVLQV